MRYEYDRRQHQPSKVWVPGTVLVLAGLVAIGVFTDMTLRKLSQESLTLLAGVGCAGGVGLSVGLPLAALAAVVLLRRERESERPQQAYATPTMTPPQILVVPPMALPPGSQADQYPPPFAGRNGRPPRQFSVIGEDD